MTWNRMISGAWIARGNGNGNIAYYLKPDGRLVQNETILQPLKRNEGCRRVRDSICWNLLVFFAKRRWVFFGNIGLYSWQKPSNGRPRFFCDRGDYQEALKIIEKILTTDLRCLDAHAHLGNWEFNSTNEPYRNTIDKAKRHYEVGVKIGDLSFSNDIGFNGVLRWGHINNRPFLRCLHGYGLSLWRLGKSEEAREVFNRMLWLNPLDNQGIRFLLAEIDAGKTWYELYKNSDND